MSDGVIIDGIRITFERRRYGRTFYTWAYAHFGQERVTLGDPWPCATPKVTELRESLNYALAGRVTPVEVAQ